MGTSVYVGIMEDGTEVAVKRIIEQEFDDTAKNELEILSRIDASKSPFIVSYRKCLEDSTFVYIRSFRSLRRNIKGTRLYSKIGISTKSWSKNDQRNLKRN